MKRLTRRNKKNNISPVKPLKLMYMNSSSENTLREILERLAHYEELEEQGQLHHSPCKIGDTIYKIESDHIEAYVVSQIKITEHDLYVHYQSKTAAGRSRTFDFGKTIFLNEEEAKQISKESTV